MYEYQQKFVALFVWTFIVCKCLKFTVNVRLIDVGIICTRCKLSFQGS